jgi:hypothetical protein
VILLAKSETPFKLMVMTAFKAFIKEMDSLPEEELEKADATAIFEKHLDSLAKDIEEIAIAMDKLLYTKDVGDIMIDKLRSFIRDVQEEKAEKEGKVMPKAD